MRRKRCTLCGGKLVNGICQECGLDNRKSDSRYQTRNGTPHWGNETNERGKVQIPKEKTGKKTELQKAKSSMIVQAERKTSGKKGPKIFAGIILFLFLINIVSSLVGEIQKFFMERNYQVKDESDPSAQTDAVLKEKGAFYENQLVQGEYVVGVHIPEGKYTIELMEGYGGMQVLDMEHNIYVYEFFSEEYEAGTDFITECEDVRLFAGATVKILSSGVRLRFSSENAQIEEMTGIKNPLTEQVHLKAGEKLRAGKDFEAGVYNLYYEGTKESEYGTFAWLVPGTVTEEARKEYDAYTEVVFVEDRLSEVGGLHCCNIVLPEDTVIYSKGVGVRLVPSEVIVSEDYASAYEYIDTEE